VKVLAKRSAAHTLKPKLPEVASPIDWATFAIDIVGAAGVVDPDTESLLIRAFAHVPRTGFISESYYDLVLSDQTLPTWNANLTVKPTLIARTLGMIGIRKGMRILEVGLSSGYASAVMTAAGAYVFATDPSAQNIQEVRRRLDKLNFQNVIIRLVSEKIGWPEHGPYDAIVSFEPVESVEPALFEQLYPDKGRLVAFEGTLEDAELVMYERNGAELQPGAAEEGISRYSLGRCNIVDNG
jgi:protein-L-isoaspartate(D-aspartate) O-methyltransferase